jgi:hypothetical protein
MAENPLNSAQDAALARLEERHREYDRSFDRITSSLDRLNARIDGLRMPSSTVAAWAGVLLFVVIAAMGYVISHTADGHPDRVLREIELLRDEISRMN